MSDIGKELFNQAVELIEKRYPSGWGGAAAVRIASGDILVSVAPDVKNDGLSLCMEVGAYLEAHKLNQAVTHSLCICREDEHSEYLITLWYLSGKVSTLGWGCFSGDYNFR